MCRFCGVFKKPLNKTAALLRLWTDKTGIDGVGSGHKAFKNPANKKLYSLQMTEGGIRL